jgi:peptidoglycan/LPS O-acetylase OafA/YrhL
MTQETASVDSAPGRLAGATRRMDWLDYIRIMAALWVLMGHYCAIGGLDPRVSPTITGYGPLTVIGGYGMIGLDWFFMTSGLVITLTVQRHSAAEFFTRRVVRIYPTFVFCMTLTALFTLHSGIAKFHVSPMQYLANLAINPLPFGYRPVDAVYWSLAVEEFFYFCFLMILLTGLINRLQLVIAVWIVLQVLCVRLPFNLPLLSYNYYFLSAGAVMALIYQGRNLRLNYGLLAISLPLCLYSIYHYALQINRNPWVFCVLVVALFGLFLVFRKTEVRLPFAKRIASLTYPLYLLHFHIGLSVINWIGPRMNQWVLLTALMAVMLGAAFVIDDVIEFRLHRFWMRLVRGVVYSPLWSRLPRLRGT